MNILHHHQHTYRQRGTTGGVLLLELLVALALFGVVVTIATGTVLQLVQANKQARAIETVMNNLNFAVENMSRTIRTGIDYRCAGDTSGNLSQRQSCTSGNTLIAIEGQNGDRRTTDDQIVFRFTGSTLERSTDGGSTFKAVTAPSIEINRGRFYVFGAAEGGAQPRVVITIDGTAVVDSRTSSDFNLQTAVTQRLIDL